jgi:hypothetical protein
VLAEHISSHDYRSNENTLVSGCVQPSLLLTLSASSLRAEDPLFINVEASKQVGSISSALSQPCVAEGFVPEPIVIPPITREMLQLHHPGK